MIHNEFHQSGAMVLEIQIFEGFYHVFVCVCGTVSSMLSGLACRYLGLHTLGTK